jgi:acyl-CoA synthetase (AMP-forming)/AMP-acid ligase II
MRSEGPPLRDIERMTWIGDIPGRWAGERPDRPAIVLPERGRQTSYGQLNAWTHRFVEVMQARGLQAGDRIGYLGRNSDLFFAALFGAIAGRFVLLPLNWRCAVPELAFMLADAGVRFLITDEEFEPAALAATAAQSALTGIGILRTEGPGSLREALQPPPRQTFAVPHEPQQVCVQIYTSGTTGRPKGVLLTHVAFSYARHTELVSEDWANWSSDDVIVSPLPNFHTGGMSWMLIGLVRGLKCVQITDASAEHLLDVIQTYSVTRTFIVPTLVSAVLDHLKKTGRTTPGIRTITYGAAVMSEHLLEEAIAMLNCEFGQYYGMTEACGTVTYLPASAHDLQRPHLLKSVGKPQCGTAVEIRDAAGNVLEANRPGEIWVRTPALMAGYWNLPEATGAAIVDGWYRTGDGGYLDHDGYLYLTDRIRDMIISGGENIYPAQVEDVLRRHPAVREAAVVGIPDERWGERVVALVERRDGMQLDADELIAFARQNIAGYKCPKVVQFIDALPRTAMGKVQRAMVRAAAAKMQPAGRIEDTQD